MDHEIIRDARPQIITVRSSAGSGKTYRLAEHYLKVLLESALADSPLQTRMANIVAITFTNKAAQEMRSRIIDWMKRIILDIPFDNSPVKPLDTIMQGILTTPPGPDGTMAMTSGSESPGIRRYLIESMDRRFSELLREFSHFNVGTIDSFVNLTLKASALRLNLPPDFEVSMETRELVNAVMRECVELAAEDPVCRQIFDNFLERYIELMADRTDWLPVDSLRSTILSLWVEEAKENRECSVPQKSQRGVLQLVRRDIADTADRITACTREKNLKLKKYVVNVLDACRDLFREIPLDSKQFQNALCDCVLKGSIAPDESDSILWEHLRNLRGQYADALASSRFIPYLDVYGLFRDIFRKEIMLLRRVIPIDQINRLMQGIVGTSDFVPEVYYTLSERYTHFLIDEFQDTSLLQWKNIEILAEEALSRGGTLFLVGDRKQAIYRWRGGNPDLVEHIAGYYRGQYETEQMELDTNYRSSENIVFFNNTVFDELNLPELARAILEGHGPETTQKIVGPYRDSRQRVLEFRKDTGYVVIEKVIDDSTDSDTRDILTKERLYEIIEKKLQELMPDILMRGYREREIAVLVRTREEARIIVNILLSMDLGVESEYTVSIRNNEIIREIIAFLKFIDKPDDDKSFAVFITGKIFKAIYASLAGGMTSWLEEEYLARKGTVLYSRFKQAFPDIWLNNFEPFVQRSGYLPLYDLLTAFIRKWEILANFPGHIPYILHCLELIKNLENTEHNTISSFINYFETDEISRAGREARDEKPFLLTSVDSLNAVKVLTIHKAKGLEFPVVILPFITLNPHQLGGNDRQLFFRSKDQSDELLYLRKDIIEASRGLTAFYREIEREYLSDELNNLYVAFTRAEEELYIFMTDRKKRGNRLINYLFERKEFLPFINGERIMIGRPKPARHPKDIPAPSDENLLGYFFDNFKGDMMWDSYIRSRLPASGAPGVESLRARKKGNAIHRVLSLVHFLPIDAGHVFALSRMAAIDEGIEGEAQEISDTILSLLNNRKFACFFEPGSGTEVFNEKQIVDRAGKTFKADRIIVRPNRIDIIDYKTGEKRSETHREQVRHYGELISHIYPGYDVATHLLYVDEGEVIKA